ncbi:hypothetical protein [Bifidobacterium platyrrhinorum]|nr:hypothetical protein [Bifidobacterium platyrrhinorum]
MNMVKHIGLPEFAADREFDDIERKAMEELQGLIDAHALDSAHGDLVDGYVANLAAGVYQRVDHTYHDGLRILDRRGERLTARLSRSRSEADAAADTAADLERQTDAVYEDCLGLRATHAGVDWRSRLGWWRMGERGGKTGEAPASAPVASGAAVEPDAGGTAAGEERRRPTAFTAEPCVFPKRTVAFLLVGMLMELADPIMSASLFEAALNMPGTTIFGVSPSTCLLVVAVTAAAIGIPLAVGCHLASHRRSGEGMRPPWWLIALAAIWGLVGLSMAFLRVFEAQIEGVRPNYASSVPIGLFMLCMYACAGLDLFATSHAYFAGTYHRVRAVQRKARRAGRRLAASTARTEELVGRMASLDAVRERFTRERDLQLVTLHAREDAIKNLARLRLARSLADPAQSALVRTPLLPQRSPAAAPSTAKAA